MFADYVKDARIVFWGTPEFAVPSLDALSKAQATIVAVVTRPDKPAGRGLVLSPSPVKARAVALGLRVIHLEEFQPDTQLRTLYDLTPDAFVVVAYGRLLSPRILSIPLFGAVNVHASLLPKFRGAAPVPAAILAGETETGVTIMKLDEGMDTGPILSQTRMVIAPDDTTGTLSARLAHEGAQLLIPTLDRYLAGTLAPVPQSATGATVCRPLKKTDGLIDWSLPASATERRVRACNPWPHAYTFWVNRRLLVHKARSGPAHAFAESGRRAPGTVFTEAEGLHVATGENSLCLEELQLEGRGRLTADEFVRGYPQFVGTVLGEVPPS